MLDQKNGPWTGSNYLGNYLEIEGSTSLRKSVLKMPEWGMPKVWTIMLGLDLTNINFNIGGVFGLVAEIAAGSGGTTQELEVDWVNGVCVSMPMNAVSVIVRYDQQLTSFPGNYGTLRARVTLAPGVRAGPDPILTKKAAGGSVAVGAFSTYLQIPSFARRLLIFDGAGNETLWAPGVQIRFITTQVTGQPADIVQAAELHNALPDGVNVPQYARWVRLFNGSLTDISEPYYRFTIGV